MHHLIEAAQQALRRLASGSHDGNCAETKLISIWISTVSERGAGEAAGKTERVLKNWHAHAQVLRHAREVESNMFSTTGRVEPATD